MPKCSTQHPTKWLARSTWTIKVFFPEIALRFSFRARREQFWLLHWVFFGKQRKISPQIPEISFEPQTCLKISLKHDSGHVQRSSDKPVVNLWPKERTLFVQKAEKSKTSNFTNEYRYKKHKKVLRICPRAGKYKFWHLARNFSAICRRSFSWKCKNHIEFKLLSETSFPHHILLETRMHFWQPAEKFFVKFQKENEIEKFQTHSSCLSGQQQSVMFWQTCRKFSRKIPKFYCSQCKKLISKFYEKIKCLRNVPLDW